MSDILLRAGVSLILGIQLIARVGVAIGIAKGFDWIVSVINLPFDIGDIGLELRILLNYLL